LVARIREIAPAIKPWTYLAGVLGLHEKTARNRLRRLRKFSADEIALLLRTEEGNQFLATLMGQARPRWYRRMLGHAALDDARRHEKAARKLLREAIDGVGEIDQAIQRASDVLQSADARSPASNVAREGDQRADSAVAQSGA
jgi:hypothetical protein